jgi:hypothetical protein
MTLRTALALLSFLLYTVAAIVAVRHWPSFWDVEYSLSIPSAVSNIVDGVPLGKVDTNILKEFKGAIAGGYDAAAVERVFKAAKCGEIPRGDVVVSGSVKPCWIAA